MADATDLQVGPVQNVVWGTGVKYLLAGGVAGGVARTSVAPLSRLKVLIQVQGPVAQAGIVQGFTQIVRTEGVRGLYVGNGADCIRIIPHSAAKFFFYEHFKSLADNYYASAGLDPHWQPALRMLCGSSAGIISGTITYPLDMIRGRLMVQGPNGLHKTRHYSGVVDAARTISRKEGFMTLYRGWLPSFIGTVLYSGLKFSIYETLKDHFVSTQNLNDSRDLSLVTHLSCGAIAGGVGQTVAYPLEVIRRRLQAGSCRPHAVETSSGQQVMVYPKLTACVRRMLKEEGVQALYKGLSLNYIRVIPSVAVSFVTYETMKELLHLHGSFEPN